jgi:hypothetical protein
MASALKLHLQSTSLQGVPQTVARASASDFSATVALKRPHKKGLFSAVLVSQPKEEAQR